ncbi:hypothetical protein VPNG_08131 [Cytospora leucostoma]|uniref:Uncharacterized protein n=1 Tax=Cytospora leucostoma TaxID=1230097 RepID=A0A423WIE7_9PEZI|nr:hypothetical protein VPNG_08131 [Cytospora leucostoma]
MSASTLGNSTSSAHSEQMAFSIFDGKTLCSTNTSPSTDHPYHQYSPTYEHTYEHSQTTPMTPFSPATFSMGPPSIDAVYTQGSAALYPTDQNFCKMIDLGGGMEAYSPSCNAAIDACKSFEGQPPLYSPEDCFSVAKDSLDMTTRDTDVSQYAVESLGSDQSDVTSNDPAGKWSPNKADSVLPLSPTVKCRFPKCTFSPESDGRPVQKLEQAVQKHFKRNHDAKNYKCGLCPQVIQKRLDNFREHIRKKHPEVDLDQYLGTTGKRRQSECVSYGPPSMSPQHKRLRSSA